MEVIIVENEQQAADIVAGSIGLLMAETSAPVIGLATGSTPLAVYAELRSRYESGDLSFADTTAFLLDEYVGIPHHHPESYRSVIRRVFTDHVDLPPSSLHGPDGEDPKNGGARYEAMIESAGGIDIQLLGIGSDGHIGFNEPSSSLASRTRLKSLTAQTRRDNSRYFGDDPDDVPRHVLTQGVATILDARHLILMAFGSSKAGPVAAAVEGPVTAMLPASALQLHQHATVVVDEAASIELRLRDYYRECYANKPAWQRI